MVKLALAAVAASVLAVGAQAGDRVQVHATISYAMREGVIQQARLEIRRGGTLRFATSVRSLSHGRADLLGLRVRDLDGDGEPEILLDLYTRGAHCCWQSLVYRYVAPTYRETLHGWGNVDYRLADLDHDGRPELRSADDRFAYAFTDFADSFFPVRIWHFDRGRFLEVTRRFPATVEADATKLWRDYLELRRSGRDGRGALAAWLADEYQLGRSSEGWEQLDKLSHQGALGSQATAYLNNLRVFLRKLGYTPR
ncbi:MAG: hypothetical protein C5B48_11655 [Candidatus Rokuibacteriota bacterium]|nr:MAG: hypothetical protein C5B48_11655 [Candidatus Rokubacteria bacterium]